MRSLDAPRDRTRKPESKLQFGEDFRLEGRRGREGSEGDDRRRRARRPSPSGPNRKRRAVSKSVARFHPRRKRRKLALLLASPIFSRRLDPRLTLRTGASRMRKTSGGLSPRSSAPGPVRVQQGFERDPRGSEAETGTRNAYPRYPVVFFFFLSHGMSRGARAWTRHHLRLTKKNP